MPKVLTDGTGFQIGAYKFPTRKKPCLCVEKDSEIKVYGTFHSVELANEFMNELGKMVGAIFEGKENDNA